MRLSPIYEAVVTSSMDMVSIIAAEHLIQCWILGTTLLAVFTYMCAAFELDVFGFSWMGTVSMLGVLGVLSTIRLYRIRKYYRMVKRGKAASVDAIRVFTLLSDNMAHTKLIRDLYHNDASRYVRLCDMVDLYRENYLCATLFVITGPALVVFSIFAVEHTMFSEVDEDMVVTFVLFISMLVSVLAVLLLCLYRLFLREAVVSFSCMMTFTAAVSTIPNLYDVLFATHIRKNIEFLVQDSSSDNTVV